MCELPGTAESRAPRTHCAHRPAPPTVHTGHPPLCRFVQHTVVTQQGRSPTRTRGLNPISLARLGRLKEECWGSSMHMKRASQEPSCFPWTALLRSQRESRSGSVCGLLCERAVRNFLRRDKQTGIVASACSSAMGVGEVGGEGTHA